MEIKCNRCNNVINGYALINKEFTRCKACVDLERRLEVLICGFETLTLLSKEVINKILNNLYDAEKILGLIRDKKSFIVFSRESSITELGSIIDIHQIIELISSNLQEGNYPLLVYFTGQFYRVIIEPYGKIKIEKHI